MTQAERVYAETLNLLGSDPVDSSVQEALDHEHALADPVFARVLAKRWTMKRLMTD